MESGEVRWLGFHEHTHRSTVPLRAGPVLETAHAADVGSPARVPLRAVAAGPGFCLLLTSAGRVLDSRAALPSGGRRVDPRLGWGFHFLVQGTGLAGVDPAREGHPLGFAPPARGGGDGDGGTDAVVAVAAGGEDGAGFAAAVTASGRVFAWGDATAGALGGGQAADPPEGPGAAAGDGPAWWGRPRRVWPLAGQEAGAGGGRALGVACGPAVTVIWTDAAADNLHVCGAFPGGGQPGHRRAALGGGSRAAQAAASRTQVAAVCSDGALLVAEVAALLAAAGAGAGPPAWRRVGPTAPRMGMPPEGQAEGGGGGLAGELAVAVALPASGERGHCLTGGGSLFSWGGGGRQGELGLGRGTPGPLSVPHRAAWARRLAGVAAADHFSVAWDRDGRAWGFGRNREGQLGAGDASRKYQGRPVRLPGGARVRSVAAFPTCCVAVVSACDVRGPAGGREGPGRRREEGEGGEEEAAGEVDGRDDELFSMRGLGVAAVLLGSEEEEEREEEWEGGWRPVRVGGRRGSRRRGPRRM